VITSSKCANLAETGIAVMASPSVLNGGPSELPLTLNWKLFELKKISAEPTKDYRFVY
jgi:hypothetical protein